jgi:hypothetical protein
MFRWLAEAGDAFDLPFGARPEKTVPCDIVRE